MSKLLVIVGPTASGKTDLAVAMAKKLSGEIISCDSMQVYTGFDIGTAKPTKQEQSGIPHHLIDILDPIQNKNFSCADYREYALRAIAQISSQGNLPILCGGTGLYVDTILRKGEMSKAGRDENYRLELTKIIEDNIDSGVKILHSMLERVDIVSAEAIHPNNYRRVIRALEIYHSTGITKSEWDKKSKVCISDEKDDVCIIGLGYKNREILYSRIDKRVDLMISDRLVDEVKKLYYGGCLSPESSAAQAIGYKEIIPYINGEISLDMAVRELKAATRRYAKRQITWFKRYDNINWVYPDENAEVEISQDIQKNGYDYSIIAGNIKTFEEIVNISLNIFNQSSDYVII